MFQRSTRTLFGISIAIAMRSGCAGDRAAGLGDGVLKIARENARKVRRRRRPFPGDRRQRSSDVDWGSGYDLVLLPRFSPPFRPGCLRVVVEACATGSFFASGRAHFAVEFVYPTRIGFLLHGRLCSHSSCYFRRRMATPIPWRKLTPWADEPGFRGIADTPTAAGAVSTLIEFPHLNSPRRFSFTSPREEVTGRDQKVGAIRPSRRSAGDLTNACYWW